MRISDYLNAGRENAIPIRQLIAMLRIPSRSIRRMIQRERLNGVPILSDTHEGYYLPGNDSERERFCRSMRHRADEITRAADAVERATIC